MGKGDGDKSLLENFSNAFVDFFFPQELRGKK